MTAMKTNPFNLMRQGIDEIEQWFETARRRMQQTAAAAGEWSPAIEAFHRGNEFVVRAEVPGMSRHDLTVEAADEALTIRGERKREQQPQDRSGSYWSERNYGTFCRVVPLPPGTIADSAKATFADGVLEVVMQAAPQEARRGRKVDISGTPHETKARNGNAGRVSPDQG